MFSVFIFMLSELYNDVNNVEKSNEKNVLSCLHDVNVQLFYLFIMLF